MQTNLKAIDPNTSACVSASAGTGKTWLLISRLVRLLLNDTPPDSILAITFTRKAAAEMRQRLSQRLLELACADENELTAILNSIGLEADRETLRKSRGLYEQLLHAPRPVVITTFHAFCQDVLRRFPLEANVPPGFELLESTADLQQAAWDLLFAEATADPDSELAHDLDTLFEHCGSVFTTKAVLDNFLQHRSDWWAYTETAASITDYARDKLETFLQFQPSHCSFEKLFGEGDITELREYQTLLLKHGTKTFIKSADDLEQCINQAAKNEHSTAFDLLTTVFLTDTGTPRKHKESKSQEKSMTAEGQVIFLRLHHQIAEQILLIKDALAKQKILLTNTAWYRTGSLLLNRFQTLKQEQRVLDFSDLEWKVYQLLNQADHAHWVQYKLDSRIGHFLIDEFQDTNPTQWHLIAPLLEELASGDETRQRSVFIVGDTKQSIYRFRRADPALFNTAQTWLTENINATVQPLDKSWRSAPAIINCVNSIFSHESLRENIQTFAAHSTHQTGLWGQVEIMPLVTGDDTIETMADDTPVKLRNPLDEPRILEEDTRHYREGQLIAKKIRQLVQEKTLISHEGKTVAVNYNHIMLLLRHRTHASAYEQALRDNDIPYSGANRGTLLDCLEINDMVSLLEILVTPHNDIALASVLRCPIFSCSNDDLIQLVLMRKGTWMERLAQIATTGTSETLSRASQMLHAWQEYSGTIPVHDLLDKIFLQGNVIKRYQAASPLHLRQRVKANLIRFLELALEVDSGRYPGIGRFLLRLKTLQSRGNDAPDEAPANTSDAQVNIMTIHASKGLETPVLFLADAANNSQPKQAHQAMVNWPSNTKRPELFMLTGKKSDADSRTLGILELNQAAEKRENANLLYVALTRAKQLLFVSGCKPNRGKDLGWYGMIREQLTGNPCDDNCDDAPDSSVIISEGKAPQQSTETSGHQAIINMAAKDIPAELSSPLPQTVTPGNISPSKYNTSDLFSETPKTPDTPSQCNDEDAQLRGVLIHRILQLLCEDLPAADIETRMPLEFPELQTGDLLRSCISEAEKVFSHSSTTLFFHKDHYIKSFNEVPIQYTSNNKNIYGIIDRLVIYPDHIHLVDYKTHTDTRPEQQDQLVAEFSPQLQLYRAGIKKLWPNKPVKTSVLFTRNIRLADID